MKKVGISMVAALFVVAIVAAPALAGVHLKPPNQNPSFTDNGLTLTANGNLAGLGFGDVLVNMVATADVTATCSNNGGHAAPGQNPAPVTVSGSEAIPATAIKNGNTPFSVITNAPITPIAGAPDCANPGWTETITDLSFTSATITVEQPAGTPVLKVACTFNPATKNGAVPAATVTCKVV